MAFASMRVGLRVLSWPKLSQDVIEFGMAALEDLEGLGATFI